MSCGNDLPDSELPRALWIAMMRLGRRLRNERTDFSVTITQLAVLGRLARHGPLTSRELADEVQPPSLTAPPVEAT